jgi:hypothetical protein
MPGLRVIPVAVAAATGVASIVAPAAPAPPRYHLVGRPIVAFAHFNPGRGYYYTVYARLNRPVPRLADGSTRAYFLLDRSDSIRDFGTVGRKSHNCYAQVFDNTDIYTKRLKRPRSGTSVPVSVVVKGFPPVISTRVRLERTPKPALADADRFYGTKLGCYGRPAGTSRSSA